MTGPRDPGGKRALFSVPEGDVPSGPTRESVDPEGKSALYSTATRRVGTVVLDCARCKGRTRVSYPEFARRHLPAWLWLPWREHSRFMVCPACGNRAWVAARWLE
jgi:hypothetical protein